MNDLIQIMNIGNQLYSSLSRQLARQSYLMQRELPAVLMCLMQTINSNKVKATLVLYSTDIPLSL